MQPTAAKAAWLIEGFKRNRFLPAGVTIPANLGPKTFRSDLHHLALKTAKFEINHALRHA